MEIFWCEDRVVRTAVLVLQATNYFAIINAEFALFRDRINTSNEPGFGLFHV